MLTFSRCSLSCSLVAWQHPKNQIQCGTVSVVTVVSADTKSFFWAPVNKSFFVFSPKFSQVHLVTGAGGSAGDNHNGATHLHHLRSELVAVGRTALHSVGVFQGRLDWSVGFHVDGLVGRPILRHCGPFEEVSCARRRKASHPHDDWDRAGHLGAGHHLWHSCYSRILC